MSGGLAPLSWSENWLLLLCLGPRGRFVEDKDALGNFVSSAHARRPFCYLSQDEAASGSHYIPLVILGPQLPERWDEINLHSL